MTNILVVDNYDSFVYNLVQYLGELGARCTVLRNDQLSADTPLSTGVDGVLLSPGPGVPGTAGACIPLIRRCAGRLPILGVCLGHQAIAAAFGGRIEPAAELLHGKTSAIEHDGQGVFAGLPQPFTAGRYHSLIVAEASIPEELVVTARTTGGLVMGLRHRSCAVEGVQFHPESVLTESGHQLLANWLLACGDADAPGRARRLAEGTTAGAR